MTRDSGVKQIQHFYHHGDTICHPKSGYVITKLHGTSTCRCNNNVLFRQIYFQVNLAAAKPWQLIPNRKDGSTVELIIFRVKMSVLPKYPFI